MGDTHFWQTDLPLDWQPNVFYSANNFSEKMAHKRVTVKIWEFRRYCCPAHCLHPILPSYNKSHEFLLRKRGHTFTLLHCTDNLYKTLFSPVVFLGSYNFCDVVFCIICHDVLYQFLCIAHVWSVTIKIYLLTYFIIFCHWILSCRFCLH